MDTRLPQPWSLSSTSIAGQPALAPYPRSRSHSRSSGTEGSDASSHGEMMPNGSTGAFSMVPLASASMRNGASGSGSGSLRGRAVAGPPRPAVDKAKAAQQAPQQLAPGSSVQGGASASAKVRRKRDGDGKRKKVAKACLVCQRSHLTCDEKRPCTRCVKKGIADQCVEGVRKKAKYLMEGEMEDPSDPHNLNGPNASISPAASSTHRTSDQHQPHFGLPHHTPPSVPPPSAPPHPHAAQLQSHPNPTLANIGVEDDLWLAPPMIAGDSSADSPGTRGLGPDRGVDIGLGRGTETGEGLWADTGVMNMYGNEGYDFGTSASNEYQMLDSMLNSMSPVYPFDIPGDNSLSFDSLQPQQSHNPYLSNSLHSPTSTLPPAAMSMISGQPNFSTSHSNPNQRYPANSQQALISPNWPTASNQSGSLHPGLNTDPYSSRNGQDGHLSASSAQGMGQPPWTGWAGSPSGNGVESERTRASGSSIGGRHEQGEINVWGGGQPGVGRHGRLKSGAEVYHSVVKPFDYTEGYHRLMEHISRNYQQKEVLRVVKALAVFRPSLIALQMPMSEEDEIFLERSFQRTLIELEKLISYSATPTAVWRRTGELVYANPEFCGLIGKQQDELLTGRTYIYQLFAKQSAISYWENFSVHAFENTTQNFFQPTTLEAGEIKLACSCCYTIRRDVFDLPSVIIGQFLPIPTDT